VVVVGEIPEGAKKSAVVSKQAEGGGPAAMVRTYEGLPPHRRGWGRT